MKTDTINLESYPNVTYVTASSFNDAFLYDA